MTTQAQEKPGARSVLREGVEAQPEDASHDPRSSIRPAHAFGRFVPEDDQNAFRYCFPAYAGLARP